MKLGTIFLSIVLTAIGLAGGYYAARQNTASHAEAEPESAAPKISPQLLKNLNVSVADAELQSFTRYRAVPAVVVEGPDDSRHVHAPVGGRIVEMRTYTGAIVTSGQTLITILRDPIPRIDMTLTAELLKPLNEEIHKAAADLRKAAHNAELLRTELERVRKFTATNDDSSPILPRKTEIDLRNELSRAEREITTSEEELERHGLTDQQIAEMKAGKHFSLSDVVTWRHTLDHNGFWSDVAQKIYASLPEALQKQKLTIASLGELTGAGLATAELADWVKSSPSVANRFLEIAGLLQRHHTLGQIRAMHEAGAFEEIVEVRAPSVASVPDWDVHEILARAGDRVEAGMKLIDLDNWRSLLLKCDALGSDAAALLAAIQDQQAAEAMPLLVGTGAKLSGLRIERVSNSDGAQGATGYLRIANTVLKETTNKEAKYRTWSIRPGTRYIVRLPVSVMKEVYVLSVDAVVEEGFDKVVYIQNGDSFKSAKVIVLYQDHEVAVLDGKHSEIFPGDSVAQHGAFGLGLALRNPGEHEGGDDDDHAHHHHHHH